MPGNFPVPPRNDDDLVTASIYNGDRQDIVNHLEPVYLDDHSATVGQMQVETSPGGIGTESLALSLGGEIERLRYVLHHALDPAASAWYAIVGSKTSGSVVHNPRSYGAVGDGVADDTIPIQAAIDAAAAGSGRGIVELSPGTYRITSSLTVPAGVTLRGVGPTRSAIRAAHTAGVGVTIATGAAYVVIERLTVQGPANAQPAFTAIAGTGGATLILREVDVTRAENGIVLSGVVGAVLDRVRVDEVKNGIFLWSGTRHVEVRSTLVRQATAEAYVLNGVAQVTLTGCASSDTGLVNDLAPLRIINASDIVVVNFSAINQVAKTAPAISADATSTRVVVVNCQRAGIGQVNCRPCPNAWVLVDGVVDAPLAIRAWGAVSAAGALYASSGVGSVTRLSSGRYKVVWTTPFVTGGNDTTPVLTYSVVVQGATSSLMWVRNPTAQSCTIECESGGGFFADVAFSFQVTGLRT